MKKLVKSNRGQFVIIAALLVALMMISISPLLHEAATYYTHEPWEEYLSLLGGLELNSQRLAELSLINCVQTGNHECLDSSLRQWQKDLSQMYPGQGIYLAFDLPNGQKDLFGTQINYESGLSYDWYHPSSYSSARGSFSLNMSSVGLKGYHYDVTILLNLTIRSVDTTEGLINVTIGQEDGSSVNGLNKNNFYIVSNSTPINVEGVLGSYDNTYTFIYSIYCGPNFATPINVTAIDQRGLLVTATYP